MLHALKRVDEAIQVRESEQVPILEQLGLAYDLLFAQESLALLYFERGQLGDRENAAALLRRALESADRLHLPVASRVRSLLEEHGLSSSTVVDHVT